MSGSTRIVVCEDSATYAASLAQFLGAGCELEVVAVCRSGDEALAAVRRLAPDLVTIDLELSGAGGVRAIEQIMRSDALPILALSAQIRRGSPKAAEALAAGALEALPKSQLRLEDPGGAAAVSLRHRLRRLARARVNPAAGPRAPAPASPLDASLRGTARAVGICASTGGPKALEMVLADLPGDFPLPVLVVQHMSAGFIDGFMRWLDQRVALPVRVADAGQRAEPGIWFPPEDAHLVLTASMRFALDRETVAGAHRPSADVLLESMASAVGAGAIGVVLTGMGSDGAAGVGAIRRGGGGVIAQDEASSAVFGMPKAAAEAGADVVLPLAQIAGVLRRLHVARAAA